MRRAVPPWLRTATGVREGRLPGTLLFARWVIPALAACFVFGVGDMAQPASDPWAEEDEADVFGDLDPRNRSGPRAHTGLPGAGTHGHVIDLAGPVLLDPTGPFPTRRAGGVGRNPRLPERLTVNHEARRFPGTDLKGHAVSASPSNPSVREMARTVELPPETVVIPGHPNFTQLTTGPPLAAAFRLPPVAAPEIGRRPCFIADSLSSPASVPKPASLPAIPALAAGVPFVAFESSGVRSHRTIAGSYRAGSRPANQIPDLALLHAVRSEVTITVAATELPPTVAEAVRTL